MANEPHKYTDAQARQQHLLEQMKSAPIVDILGVVAPSGPCGGRCGDGLWNLMFSLQCWRINVETIQSQPLPIWREVTNEELNQFMNAIVPYTVVRIKARLGVDWLLGNPRGFLEDFVGIDTDDEELNSCANQLQKPVMWKDSVLGTFTLDRRVNWFTNDVVWDGLPVSLALSTSEPDALQEALTTAHSLWESQEAWSRRIRDFAVKELLPLKNDCWLDEDEVELTADQFTNRMVLESITANPDGSFDFWHSDGDLFLGHAIQIRGTLADGPTHADIPG